MNPTDVLFARAQMGFSLAFHIIFAAVGMTMPVLMIAAEIVGRRRRDPVFLALAKRWAKGTAVFFAVGAVSGTVLSFELGLLFPRFMEHSGALIGLPFSLEGFAFFTEAIFLGIYLYGWDKVRAPLHVAAGLIVAVSGNASAVFVTLVNAWMNAPVGFRVQDGEFVDIDPLAAMASPFVFHEVVHAMLAAWMATAMAVGAIHALALLRQPASAFHRKAFALALCVTIPCALAQPLIGHEAGQAVARHQPAKLAAMEGLRHTTRGAPVQLGPIEIPGLLSFLAKGDFDATVQGLEDFPADELPPTRIVRPAYLLMISLGMLSAGYAALVAFLWLRRRRLPDARWLLRATVALGPAGYIALEAGWTVTEVGRQPWVIYGVMRTADSVTPVPHLWVPFVTFMLVYVVLGLVVLEVLRRQVRSTTEVAP
jgi:cytochrome bd ubiquinol oxidase subunit I